MKHTIKVLAGIAALCASACGPAGEPEEVGAEDISVTAADLAMPEENTSSGSDPITKAPPAAQEAGNCLARCCDGTLFGPTPVAGRGVCIQWAKSKCANHEGPKIARLNNVVIRAWVCH